MEVSLLENGNNGKDAILASKSNGTSDERQSTSMTVHGDTYLENEACNHFSIREYVAQANKQDPHSCSPFEIDKLTLNLLPPVPQKKFRRWDCSGCVNKMIYTDGTQNGKLALSSDQSAANNVGTCLISILGTSPVPLNILDNAEECKSPLSSMNEINSKKDMTCATLGGCNIQAAPHAVSPDMSDNEPLSTFIKSEKRRVMQDPDRAKAHIEFEKSKEIDELMATTSINSDLPESPVASKISKVHVKKARKVRSIAEIIGTDKLVPPKNDHSFDDGTARDLAPVKERKENEVAGNSGFINAKLKNKSKALEVGMLSLKECTPVEGMDEHLTPMKEILASAVACKPMLCKAKTKKSQKTLKPVVPPHKECTPIDCVDEDITPMKGDLACEIASTSGLIKAKSKTKYKALEVVDVTSVKLWLKKGKKTTTHNKWAKLKNSEGRSITYPSSRLLSFKKTSVDKNDKNEFLVANVVRRKRTKKPRKIVYAAGIGDEIGCMKSCHKSLQLIGNKEANSNVDPFKKRKIDESIPQCSAHRIRKKKQKISENIPSDIPMDIVELLARSLRDKHLTDETDSISNSNTNSKLRESPQNIPPNRKLVNFSRQKSAFIRTTETNVSEYMPRPIYCQSSTHVGNINLTPTRLDPTYGYMNHFPDGSVILRPGNGRCLDFGCTLLQPNANPVHQTEFYRNEVIPATHLLQLMNASTPSNPNLNLKGFTRPYYNPQLMPSHCQSLNQNPYKLFRPQPRLGVLGSHLQKEITSPSSNCGTQSGYRIGNGSIPAEGICTVNRNPADFTVVDENNEYMIDFRKIKPLTGVNFENLDCLLYLSRGIGSDQGFPTSRLLHNRVVN